MSELSRLSLLRRASAAGLALALPPSLLEPAAPAPTPPAERVAPTRGVLTEWWVESEHDGMVVAQINDAFRRVHLETHFIPPRGDVYVRFRPGREYPFERLAIRVKAHGAEPPDIRDVELNWAWLTRGAEAVATGSTGDPRVHVGAIARAWDAEAQWTYGEPQESARA